MVSKKGHNFCFEMSATVAETRGINIHSAVDPAYAPPFDDSDPLPASAARRSPRVPAPRIVDNMVDLDHVAPEAFSATLNPAEFPEMTALAQTHKALKAARARLCAAKNTAARAERDFKAASRAVARLMARSWRR